MNLNSSAEPKKEVESVSNRVKNTKKEIEQLKNELEKLINLGSQPSFPKLNLEPKPPEPEKSLRLPEKAHPQSVVPPEPPKTITVRKKPQNEPDAKKIETEKKPASCPKKGKGYNVVETREYIKKQKEKRAVQLKAQINTVDNQLDLKKQRLKELHQKTLELVGKNVQLKRERSKSREPEPVIRLDKSKSRERLKSQERIGIRNKSKERVQPQTSALSKERASRPRNRIDAVAPPNVKSKDVPKSYNIEVVPKNKSELDKVDHKRQPRDRLKGTATEFSESGKSSKPETAPSTTETSRNMLAPPSVLKAQSIDLEKTIFLNDNKSVASSNSKSKHNSSLKEKNKRKDKTFSMLEHSVVTDACLKETKETQTGNIFEGLMRPPPAVPYPYNFINTVKRKLKDAINSPVRVDVGVQNSLTSIDTPEGLRVKSKEEIRELLIQSTKSVLKSFASHKCPNLDLKAVEDLELVPHSGKNREFVSKDLFGSCESDSDTSKNIPDISSESFVSEAKPNLNLKKVNDLKLQKSSTSSVRSEINTATNGYPKNHENSYSSDFNDKISTTVRTVSEENKDDSYASVDNVAVDGSSIDFNKNMNFFRNGIENQREIDSQQSFKSLLTESHFSKSGSSSESIHLKEPPVSLNFRKHRSQEKKIVNTVTLNSASYTPDFIDEVQNEQSNESFKSLATEDSIPSQSNSVSERLNFSKSFNKTSDKSKTDEKSSLTKINSLQRKENESKSELNPFDVVKSQMKNITLRPSVSSNNNVNEIHLKFEAEVRLLNDFNESFKQFMAVEKAFENLKTQNETNLAMTKILQNVDTQTSVITKTSANVSTEVSTERSPGLQNSSINFSRGSEIIEQLNDSVDNNLVPSVQNSTFSTDWNLSNFNETTNTSIVEEDEDKSRLSISNIENISLKNCAPILSLNIFDQLIKDEDTRIQQLKAIIKIREQALLDRTKGELVWLEIQKKQLLETGKLEEASLLKKKQRGIIVKHEQERNEIKKLKQMQKEASEQRKNALKQQRNLIKTQLSTKNMLSKISVKTKKERRSSGPLRVVQSCSEHSETSISMKSSGLEELLSVASVHVEPEPEKVSDAKRTLLMREAALQKRRKAAEELLRWHRQLLDEERKIGELEAAATSMVRPARAHRRRHHLDQLWRTVAGSERRRDMAQVTSERRSKSPRQKSASESEKVSEDATYSSAFEEDEEKEKISSISELIDNFSRIEDEISTLSKKSEDIVTLKSSQTQNKESSVSSIPDVEVSVIETQIGENEKETVEKEETLEDQTVEKVDKNEDVVTVSEDVQTAAELSSLVDDLEENTEEKISEDLEVKAANFEEEHSSAEKVEQLSEKESDTSVSEDLEAKIEEDMQIPEQNIEEKLDEVSKESVSITDQNERLSQKEEQSQFEDEKDVVSEETGLSADKSTSKDEAKETIQSLSLEEAIESASNIEESLTKFNEKLRTEAIPLSETTNTQKSEEVSEEIAEDVKVEESLSEDLLSNKLSKDEETSKSISSITNTESEKKTPEKKISGHIDVKKRVSEILADASPTRGDKSPRLQDLYVTAYDVGASNPSESNVSEGRPMPTDIFGSEAEELWRKQLAIEQEIKQIELQQKEQLPYLYVREIPNKPPPPYTPPSSLSSLPSSVLPSDVKEITEIASYSSKVLNKAYQNSTLEKVKFSENGFKLFSNIEVTKMCAEFVFNICKDIARDHYRQFEKEEGPAWLILPKKPHLLKVRPADSEGLEKMLIEKLKELFGFKKVRVSESANIKWGRKKRDHVDEVLVMESQEEESQWTNFDKDELIVKNQVTEDIMKMLLEETSAVFAKILANRGA